MKLKIGVLVAGPDIRTRALVIQQKTGRPVQFEITADARGSLAAWLQRRCGTADDYVFPSRLDHSCPISTRQYARLLDEWVTAMGLRREDYGTHSLRRTKAAMMAALGERGPHQIRRHVDGSRLQINRRQWATFGP